MILKYCFIDLMFHIGVIRGLHDSCSQTTAFVAAAARYNHKINISYLHAQDIHREGAEMTQRDVILWASQFDYFIFTTHGRRRKCGSLGR